MKPILFSLALGAAALSASACIDLPDQPGQNQCPPEKKEQCEKPAAPDMPIPKFLEEKFDKDKDGCLSPEERECAKKEILKRFDTDGNGELSEAERKNIHEEIRKEFERRRGGDGKGKGDGRGPRR